ALQRAVLLQSGLPHLVRAAALDRRRGASPALSPDSLGRIPRTARRRRLRRPRRIPLDQPILALSEGDYSWLSSTRFRRAGSPARRSRCTTASRSTTATCPT